jgi:hypothetical protein
LVRVGEVADRWARGSGAERPLDSLASQESLTFDRAHNLLFAVNAGSNTVTSFPVSGGHLSRLQTVPSGGIFPVSVSAGHNRLYVLDAGGSGNVTGYRSFWTCDQFSNAFRPGITLDSGPDW